MIKYIDVEPFENALMAVQKRSDVISIAEVLNTLMKYPAADVQEVKQGRWIKNDGRYGWHCSVCGEDDLYAFAWNSDTGEHELQDHYCPNCGAKMVNEDDDTD